MSIISKLSCILKQGYHQKVIKKSELANNIRNTIKMEFAEMINEIVETNSSTGNTDIELIVVINEGDLNPTLR